MSEPHITPTLFARIEALGFVAGSENPLGWVVAEVERLRTESTRLQTALDLTREAAVVAVNEALAERDAAFTQGVRRGLEEALDVVNTATGAADNRLRATGGRRGADVCDELRAVGDVIAAVDPASVKP